MFKLDIVVEYYDELYNIIVNGEMVFEKLTEEEAEELTLGKITAELNKRGIE